MPPRIKICEKEGVVLLALREVGMTDFTEFR
jgi:hypothetical protein